ncbi:hypothetical protein V6Z11_D05G336200 [Gossypium hirsutum]
MYKSEKLERCCNHASLIVANSTAGIEANAFSGRADSEHVEGSIDSKRNRWFGGVDGGGDSFSW